LLSLLLRKNILGVGLHDGRQRVQEQGDRRTDHGLPQRYKPVNSEILQTKGITLLLTYADRSAVGFFRKQAFEATIDSSNKEWHGYIKAYDGALLMECRIDSTFKYTNFRETLAKQKQELLARIKECI
jgi:hypothetical protein